MKYLFECQVAVNVLINFSLGQNNEFNLLALNVRGIPTFEKWTAVF